MVEEMIDVMDRMSIPVFDSFEIFLRITQAQIVYGVDNRSGWEGEIRRPAVIEMSALQKDNKQVSIDCCTHMLFQCIDTLSIINIARLDAFFWKHPAAICNRLILPKEDVSHF